MWKRTVRCLILAGLALPLTVCSSESVDRQPSEEELALERVKEETQEAVEAASDYIGLKKEEYTKQAKNRLETLDAEIEQLRSKSRELGADAKRNLRRELEQLDEKSNEAHAKLEKLKGRSDAAWEDVKAGMEEALEELRRAYNRASSRFED